MEVRVICESCGATHKVAGDNLGDQVTRFNCKRCSRDIIINPGKMGFEVTGGTLRTPFESSLPTQFGNFREIRRLASGGMGDIYIAKLAGAEGFEREVVLKILHPHLARDANFAQAMVDEAKLTVMLRHPNIVHMYNLEKTGDLLYCVMEYVPGMPLSSVQRTYRTKGGTIPVDMALYIASESLTGLAYAHELTDAQANPLHIVHRDISPQNILVTAEGWVKIIDFGIAKAATRMSLTRPGMVKGKFAYMAPEQLRGKVDHRADLFALGVVLWETLTGVRLFHSTSRMDTVQKILELDPPPASLFRKGISRELDRILKKSMQKNPDHRFKSAQEFRSELLASIAPISADKLRASVDVAAMQLGDDVVLDGEEAAPPSEEATPVVEPESLKQHREHPYQWIRWLLAAVFLVVVSAGGVLAWWASVESNTSDADAGMSTGNLPPPRDADAGLKSAVPDGIRPGGDGQASPGRNRDAGTAVAPHKPDRRRVAKITRLTRERVNQILRRYGAKFQQCANTHLPKEGISGDVELLLDFTISSGGKVLKASLVPRKLESTDFGRCFLSRVRRVRFPRHQDKSISIGLPLKIKVVPK